MFCWELIGQYSAPEPRLAQRRGPRPAGCATAHAAAHVGVGRGHAASRQGAGGRRFDRQGPRHHLGTETARPGTRARAFVEPEALNRATLEDQLAFATMIAPKLTIQGGTTEILRGIIARGARFALRG